MYNLQSNFKLLNIFHQRLTVINRLLINSKILTIQFILCK